MIIKKKPEKFVRFHIAMNAQKKLIVDIAGNFNLIIPMLADAMNKNETIKKIIQESVNFHKYVKTQEKKQKNQHQ